jgi:hypothetical protein
MRAFVFLAGGLVACNAITGLSDDYHLATAPGAPDASPVDDRDADGAASSLPPPDAATDSDALAPPFCAGQGGPNTFCTDFEDTAAAPPAFGWDANGFERNGGDFAVEGGVGRDGSRGLRVRATADGGASLKVSLWKTLPGPTSAAMSELELRFAFRIASSTMDYAALATFAFPQQNGLSTFGLGWYGDYLDTSSPPQPGDVSRFLGGVGTWHAGRVTMTREANGTTYALVTAIDGTIVDRKAGLSIGAPTSVQVRLGAYYTSIQPGALDLAFDDVVATRK